METCKSVNTPLATHFRLSANLSLQSNEEEEHLINIPYASAVGSLMYAMVCTRPDISQVVSVISCYMGNPRKLYWQATKWIFQYLNGIHDVGLVFELNSDTKNNIVGYVDSDYSGDLDKRRSLTG